MISYKQLKRYKYISFDIFDTLIKRCVNMPTDVFTLVEMYCRKKKIDCPKDFKKKRIDAEALANQKKYGFATLADIYSEIHVQNAEELKNIEIDMELSSCFPNKEYVDLFNRCIKEKNVILISDMYLSSDVIIRILDKCGIRGYKKLYVSNEEKANKVSGDLFKIVATDNGVQLSEIVHIGDGVKGDFIRPRMLGMKSFLVLKHKKKGKDILTEIINNSIALCKKNLNKYESMGCEIFGPLLLGFTKWLNDNLEKERINEAYFMSRDGLIMKQAFELLYPHKIKTEYLYGSRRAYTIPLLWKYSEFEQLPEVITFSPRLTVRQFLGRLGFDAEKIKAEVKKYGLEMDKAYENGSIFYDKNVKALYQRISGELIEQSKIEYKALSRYVKALNPRKRVALVDIGYHGTMQNAFNILLNELEIETQTKGFYVGFDIQSVFTNKISADGYVFNEQNKKYIRVIDAFIPIFEEFFLAQHGTVKYFTELNGKAEPVLDKYEYDSVDGRIVNEKELFKGLADGAMKYIKMFEKSLVLDSIKITPDRAMQNVVKLGKRPTLAEARLLGDCRFLDDRIVYIAKPSGNIKALKHEFMTCAWKIGYMKRLFKLPLPYDKLYDRLRKSRQNM